MDRQIAPWGRTARIVTQVAPHTSHRTGPRQTRQKHQKTAGEVNVPSVTAFLQSLQASSWGVFIHNKAWAFTTVEVVHVVAVSLLLGTIMIVDLRLLGRAAAKRPFMDVAGQVLPFTWTAFAVALIAGALLFISRAADYAASPVFWAKMALIALAGINMAVFEFITVRGVGTWNLAPVPPADARLAGAVSISCWIAVTFLGRLIGFTLEGD
jgi:hypothetical protein